MPTAKSAAISNTYQIELFGQHQMTNFGQHFFPLGVTVVLEYVDSGQGKSGAVIVEDVV